jgi:hypothetical protein
MHLSRIVLEAFDYFLFPKSPRPHQRRPTLHVYQAPIPNTKSASDKLAHCEFTKFASSRSSPERILRFFPIDRTEFRNARQFVNENSAIDLLVSTCCRNAQFPNMDIKALDLDWLWRVNIFNRFSSNEETFDWYYSLVDFSQFLILSTFISYWPNTWTNFSSDDLIRSNWIIQSEYPWFDRHLIPVRNSYPFRMEWHKWLGIKYYPISALPFGFSLRRWALRGHRLPRPFIQSSFYLYHFRAFKASETCFNRWNLQVRPESGSDGMATIEHEGIWLINFAWHLEICDLLFANDHR